MNLLHLLLVFLFKSIPTHIKMQVSETQSMIEYTNIHLGEGRSSY